MRVKHYINDMDGWYSCPASGECEDVLYRDDITTCTCGANEINNYIEQLEKELAEARVEINRRDELCKKCEREYEAELARYKQGVEVDGLVAYENYPWPIHTLDTALEKFHHECVRVLVMKVEG